MSRKYVTDEKGTRRRSPKENTLSSRIRNLRTFIPMKSLIKSYELRKLQMLKMMKVKIKVIVEKMIIVL
jgi:hypothetical protein